MHDKTNNTDQHLCFRYTDSMSDLVGNQDCWFCHVLAHLLFQSVQRRKDDMARNLDESRKMLMAVST